MKAWPGFVTDEEAAERFRQYVRDNFRTLEDAAWRYGVSVQMVSAVQTGRKRPTKDMCRDMGLIRLSGYAADIWRAK